MSEEGRYHDTVEEDAPEYDGDPFACPACGNADRSKIMDNGCTRLDLTLRCEACEDGEWEPSERLAACAPEWEMCDDREAIRLWLARWDWPAVRQMVEQQRARVGR